MVKNLASAPCSLKQLGNCLNRRVLTSNKKALFITVRVRVSVKVMDIYYYLHFVSWLKQFSMNKVDIIKNKAFLLEARTLLLGQLRRRRRLCASLPFWGNYRVP